MKKNVLLICLTILGCKDGTSKSNIGPSETVATSSTLEVYDFKGLEPLINKRDDNVHVVNFWATWCAPCVKELPYFEALHDKYKDENIDVLLVSLDFPNQYESKLIPFIQKHQLQSKVVAFDDTDMNTWIPAINKDWSGALPATIIYKGDKRKFFEGAFSEMELRTEIDAFLNGMN